MKIEERKNEPVADEAAAKKDEYFTALVMGKDVTEDVETSRGEFVVKYPRPEDVLRIGKISAARRNWKPQDCFDGAFNDINIVTSTLDVVVVDGPAWFKDAKAKNPDFSFKDVPDQKFLGELFGLAHSFRVKVEGTFEADEAADDTGIPAADGADADVGGGIFEGVALRA